MGWCSATEILDQAIAMTDAAISASYPDREQDATWQRRFDRALRPYVRLLAAKLRDEDWDCLDESAYYDRFGPEIHGMTDQQYREYQATQLDAEQFAAWLHGPWAQQHREVRAGA